MVPDILGKRSGQVSIVGAVVAGAVALAALMGVLSLMKTGLNAQSTVATRANQTQLDITIQMILTNPQLCSGALLNSSNQVANFNPDNAHQTGIISQVIFPGGSLQVSGDSCLKAMGGTGNLLTLTEADKSARQTGATTTTYISLLSVGLNTKSKSVYNAQGNAVKVAAPDYQFPLYVTTNNSSHRIISCGATPPSSTGSMGQTVAIIADARGMIIKNGSANPGTSVDVTFAEVVLKNSAGAPNLATLNPGQHLILDATVSGVVNGLDTGNLKASAWYYLWVISDGQGNTGTLLSTSNTASGLSLPSAGGYSYQALVAAIPTTGGVKFPTFVQTGRRFIYGGGIPLFTTGGAGMPGANPYALNPPPVMNAANGVSLANITNWLPSIATRAHVELHCGPNGGGAYWGFCYVSSDPIQYGGPGGSVSGAPAYAMLTGAYQNGIERTLSQDDIPLSTPQQLYVSVVPASGSMANGGMIVTLLGYTLD